MATFPDNFLWGTALSAHPVEGANFENDWCRWEQRPGRIPNDANSATAADHCHRFEADFELARKLGVRAHLFTVEWSRVQPTPGAFDEAAVEHYEAVVEALAAKGIEPICVLHHVTNPSWFVEQGGWAQQAAPRLFAEYAGRMAAAFASKCRWWIPIHEPMHAITMGFIERLWPPGSTNLWQAARAVRNLARAHADAYRAIHALCPEAMVGASLRGRLFRPLDANSAWDLRTARRENVRCNHLCLRALSEGRWPLSRHADPRLAQTVDFIGVSYFGSETVRFSALKPLRLCATLADAEDRPLNSPKPKTDPSGLVQLLNELGRYRLPIIVTGNGIATENDADRCLYLLDHVAALGRCVEKGLDVRGYLYYALLDGFEWTQGYEGRYGLIHVDWKTLARTPNGSAYLYKDICEHGGLRPGAISKFCPGWRPRGVAG